MTTRTQLPVTVCRQLKVWPFRRCSPVSYFFTFYDGGMFFSDKCGHVYFAKCEQALCEMLCATAPSYKATECNAVAFSSCKWL